MLRARVSARAVVLHGELYVVGGWDGRSVLQVLPHSLNHALAPRCMLLAPSSGLTAHHRHLVSIIRRTGQACWAMRA